MRLEVKETGTREYYDEFLYVVSRHKKFKKNPRRKAYEFTKFLLLNATICFISIILFYLFYLDSSDIFFVFLDGMLTILFVIIIIYLFIYKKRIKQFMNMKGVRIVDFNEEGIEYIDDDKNLRIKWEDIKYIIVNKYTICVLPKMIINGFTSINIKYKDEVIKTLKKYGKENLLQDNSRFYKKKGAKIMEEKKCNCTPECECGCQDGKECTCDESCNENCECQKENE